MLRVARNDAERNNITFKGLDGVRQYDSKFFKTALDAPLYAVSAGRSLLPQCALDATGFLSDVYKRSTRAKKFLADDVQGGKSMIEMLGVLAIIAVLTVGGIAGYSKAMEKFKINKLVSEYSSVIFQLLEHKNSLLQSNPQNQVFIGNIMEAMNIVPNSWVKKNNVYYTDSQGNSIATYLFNGELISIDMYLGGTTKNESGASVSTNFSVKLCTELLNNLALPLSSELFRVTVANSANGWAGTTRYGAKYCGTDGRKCISTATLSDFQNMCKFCDGLEGECNIGIRF